jgi:hypothetical protein
VFKSVISGAIVISVAKEFESILASDLDCILETARFEARSAFDPPPRDAALDAPDPVPFDPFDFSECLSGPDTQSFGSIVEERLQQIFKDQSGRNVLDLNIGFAEGPICNQVRSCGYDECEISVVFPLWWQEKSEAQPFEDSDRYWRTLHGRSNRFGLLARVTFRFTIPGCGEADIE